MKVGVIGFLGSIGRRHVRSLGMLGHKVIGYDTAKECDPLEKVLDSDAIVIASPTSTHHEYIGKTLDLNIPCFIEKPISHIMPDPSFVRNVAMVGYNLRFHQCVQTAKGWMLTQSIGKPLWANFVVAQKNDKYTDPVVLNWSHEIDLALYLLGPANLMNYVVGVDPVTMRQFIADLNLFHSNGCRSTVHLDYVTEPEIRQSIIVGTEATIIMDLANRHAWLRSNKGAILEAFQANDSWDSNYLDEMETFIARCQGKETIGCTGKEALEVLEICLAVK